jgi:hypothetical protein
VLVGGVEFTRVGVVWSRSSIAATAGDEEEEDTELLYCGEQEQAASLSFAVQADSDRGSCFQLSGRSRSTLENRYCGNY